MYIIYIIVSFFVACMYLCKPIASAQNPPIIRRKKWAPQSPRYNSNTAGEYPCKHCHFFLNVNTCEKEKIPKRNSDPAFN